MKATVTFSGLDVWQMGRLIRAAERAGGLPPPEVQARTTFDLWLLDAGPNRIQVIKEIRDVLKNGLAEAKGMTEALPSLILTDIHPDGIKDLRRRFEEAGARVDFR